MEVYEERDYQECWLKPGRKPIGTRWVDIWKETEERSRWVAQDYKIKGDDGRADLFAGMPPLEAKKALFRIGAPRIKGYGSRRGKKMKIMFVDIRKAHLNAKCNEDIYVKLPLEAGAGPGKVGK